MEYFHRFVSNCFAMFFKVGLNFDTESAWKGVKAVSKTWKKVLSKYKEENISVANFSNIKIQTFRRFLVWNNCRPFYQGQTFISVKVGNTVTKVGSAISANNSYRKIPSVSALKNPKRPRTSNLRKESERSEKLRKSDFEKISNQSCKLEYSFSNINK